MDQVEPEAAWYKDALIYQLHIKAFCDANGDGIGDFQGLIERLDYIERLGVTTIWVLPFYPSPLRDDGYDIADYRAINPSYGTMRDFRNFVAQAHRRGLRVITELVINHTSDQHPWFQRARRAKRGSAARGFYVWSDDDESYTGTRIIFLDTETSNWTWDPVAGQFFWHRFYSHQPDLNFDNPRVLKEVIRVMQFWLSLGVDGLRLDAIPYLVEREGTNNENLPETHAVLKRIRAALDAAYPDRMLLAEANQWPEDTRPYFGEGDECHMAFHFPLMPRIYMALAQEDRHPITDIMRQTPDIPDGCQWAIFLRNHDELTLEMVTDRERDYLWRVYAEDQRARINLGIRRRLAPLMQNDRRKMELMNSLLLSMPGTPVIYYGDELGMGDNIFLGDRDGVRTPMQWSMDRNGGFSRANPQALYLPPIMDPVYGYQTINVEAQEADPSSLLNWMRRMIGVRKQHAAFGHGDFRLHYPANRRVLVYTRSLGETTILCVANLSRSAQAVELDLSAFRGTVPIEMIGQSAFPPVGDLPYMLTLAGYGTYWFLLAQPAQLPEGYAPVEALPELFTLALRGGRLERLLEGREKQLLEQEVLPAFLPRQRWFAAKGESVLSARLQSIATLGEEAGLLSVVEVAFKEADKQSYLLPLNSHWGEEQVQPGAPLLPVTLARVRKGSLLGALVDSAFDERFAWHLVEAMRQQKQQTVASGLLRFHGTSALSEMVLDEPPKPLAVEQSNVSIAFGRQALLKLYRRLRTGEQPDVEVPRFLTEVANFRSTPAHFGMVELEENGGARTVLASLSAFVENQGDAWGVFVHALERIIEDTILRAGSDEAQGEAAPPLQYPLDLLERLGQRSGELHCALAVDTHDPAFLCEAVTAQDCRRWAKEAGQEFHQALAALKRAQSHLPDQFQPALERLLGAEEVVKGRLDSLAGLAPSGMKSRIHGDFHLGQVLVSKQDFVIIDFEGEPQRPLEERRQKTLPLRDVAGMLRSFDYAAWTAVRQIAARLPDQIGEMAPLARHWRELMIERFLAGYGPAVQGAANQPESDDLRAGLLELFLLQKGSYEVRYDLSNRPDWVGIPIMGLLELIEGTPE
ncbi:maltose alpha-D-glucosyltransferase [Aquibaculum arenosum]|uniref:Maltokinase n=1 Tax=Aquibaculum arenosum TaxID=3032591 RepID=A0ABT5YMV4_9PROT|nr:maltose alpha-D-glucosyltransferase [Fodinicurvata sp. CAU 1616]MDF2096298.1 maltose alpha-D-glucosyltransferase [Fodinicurvata sp. CAU 1616]